MAAAGTAESTLVNHLMPVVPNWEVLVPARSPNSEAYRLLPAGTLGPGIATTTAPEHYVRALWETGRFDKVSGFRTDSTASSHTACTFPPRNLCQASRQAGDPPWGHAPSSPKDTCPRLCMVGALMTCTQPTGPTRIMRVRLAKIDRNVCH